MIEHQRAVVLNVLPAQGMGFEGIPTSWDHVKHLVLPVVTLSLIPMGVISRLVRANVLEILSQEFVGALHAKGLLNRRVLYHILKNAAPSALALMGLQFGYLLGGSILVETVFNWPGSGSPRNRNARPASKLPTTCIWANGTASSRSASNRGGCRSRKRRSSPAVSRPL